MSLNTAFREAEDIKRLQKVIEKRVEEIGRPLRIMEFCGGHTHTIVKYGIDQLLEDYVIFVHGPGCPVCVLPISRVDLAIELARKDNVILCTYGDVLRVPGSQRKSLMDIRGCEGVIVCGSREMRAKRQVVEGVISQIKLFNAGSGWRTLTCVLVYVYAYAIGYSYYRRGELEV